MLLPNSMIAYFTGILSASWKFDTVYISLLVSASHDQMTRALHLCYPFQRELAARAQRKNSLPSGYLIIDETESDKSWCRKIPLLAWIKSHRGKPYVYGHHLVVLCWTDGVSTYPLRWKVYQKKSGKTKLDLAKELLVWAIETKNISPQAVLFDAYYSQGGILKYLDQQGIAFYTQLRKNRLLDHLQLKYRNKNRPYWQHTGFIKGKIKVFVVKNRKKHFATNQLGITRKKLLDTYHLRWKIEEVFRFVKSQLGFEKCRHRSFQAQSNHYNVCFLLYSILQDISKQTGLTVYAIKQKATLDKDFVKSLNIPIYLAGA